MQVQEAETNYVRIIRVIIIVIFLTLSGIRFFLDKDYIKISKGNQCCKYFPGPKNILFWCRNNEFLRPNYIKYISIEGDKPDKNRDIRETPGETFSAKTQ